MGRKKKQSKTKTGPTNNTNNNNNNTTTAAPSKSSKSKRKRRSKRNKQQQPSSSSSSTQPSSSTPQPSSSSRTTTTTTTTTSSSTEFTLSPDLAQLFPREDVQSIDMLTFLPGDSASSSSSSAAASSSSLLDTSAVQFDQLDALRLIDEDLTFLLKLKYHAFWAQVFHDDSVRKYLDSFLWHASRQSGEASLAPVVESVSRRTLLVFLRLAHRPELRRTSKFEGVMMNTEQHAKAIYDFWLFDAAKLFDLCTIFGPSNAGLVREVVSTVFEAQPLYNSDLHDALFVMCQALDEISVRFAMSDGSLKQTLGELQKVAAFLLTLASNLYWLIAVHPPVANVYNTLEAPSDPTMSTAASLLSKLTVCYEISIPLLSRELQTARTDSVDVLDETRGMLLGTVAFLFEQCGLIPCDIEWLASSCSMMADHSSKFATHSALEPHVQTGSFLRHLSRRMGLVERLTLLSGTAADTGSAQAVSRLESVVQTLALAEAKHRGSQMEANQQRKGSKKKKKSGKAKPKPDVIPQEHVAKVEQIRMLFGDMNDAFALACLEAFDFDVERTLDAVLTDNLPRELRGVQDRAKYGTVAAAEVSPGDVTFAIGDDGDDDDEDAPLPPKRTALPDDDDNDDDDDGKHSETESDEDEDEAEQRDEAFQDYLTRTGRVAKVREDPEDQAAAVLNSFQDDAEREALKNWYLTSYDEYDDEYDDTYDDFMSFEVDDTSADMQLKIERSTSGEATNLHESDKPVPAGADEEDAEEDAGQKKKPKGRGRGRGRGAKPDKPDVDLSKRTKESLRIRARRGRRKAATANHNRKRNAAKKKRGMLG